MSDISSAPARRPLDGRRSLYGQGDRSVAGVLAGLCLLIVVLLLYAVRGDRPAELVVAAMAAIAVAIVSIDAAAVVLLLFSLALVQPFALGAGHTNLGAIIACAAGAAALLSDAGRPHERAQASAKSVAVWSAALATWTVALATQHVGLDLGAAERSLEAMVAVVGAGVLTLRSSRRRLWFSRAVVLVMAGFSASYLISLLLWLKDGFGSHVVGGITLRGYGNEPIYFPFTPTSGASGIGGRLVPRLLGPLREPGLCQVFLIWSYFMTDRVGLSRRSVKLLLLAGVLATQSTAGLGILLVVWVLMNVILGGVEGQASRPLRQVGGFIVLAVALWVAVFAPTIGVQAKQASNSSSVSDRWTSTRAGLVAVVEAPLGRDLTEFPANAAINMLAATTIVGVPGLVLGLTLFVRPVLLGRRRVDGLKTGLPLLLTALVAQPVTDAPAYFVIFIAGLLPYVVRSAGSRQQMSDPQAPLSASQALQPV